MFKLPRIKIFKLVKLDIGNKSVILPIFDKTNSFKLNNFLIGSIDLISD